MSAAVYDDKVSRIEAKAFDVLSNLNAAEWDENERRVAKGCRSARLAGCALYRVPADYYSLPLAERAKLLDCPPQRLCKSIILENAHGSVVGDPTKGLALQKYVCVILQYVTKLQIETLTKQIQLHPSNPASTTPLPVKLAMCESADRLTGYGYNAMTPFGCHVPMAVVVARPIAKLHTPAYIWLGGGREDTKLRVFTAQLTRPGAFGVPGYAAAVLDCVVERSEEEEEDD